MRLCFLLWTAAGSLWGCSGTRSAATKGELKVDEVKVEQVGGFAGFGGARLKSSGIVKISSLSGSDRAALDALFQRQRGPRPDTPGPQSADQLRYRLTRVTPTGEETVEAGEAEVPAAVKASVSTKIE